jgi:hypothetical protein
LITVYLSRVDIHFEARIFLKLNAREDGNRLSSLLRNMKKAGKLIPNERK